MSLLHEKQFYSVAGHLSVTTLFSSSCFLVKEWGAEAVGRGGKANPRIKPSESESGPISFLLFFSFFHNELLPLKIKG